MRFLYAYMSLYDYMHTGNPSTVFEYEYVSTKRFDASEQQTPRFKKLVHFVKKPVKTSDFYRFQKPVRINEKTSSKNQ